jgi:hypothetical protein
LLRFAYLLVRGGFYRRTRHADGSSPAGTNAALWKYCLIPTKDKRPTQVWAVEYTTVEQRRHVAVMDSADEAQQWIDNLNRSSVEADPILLRSDVRLLLLAHPRKRFGRWLCEGDQ